MKKIVLAVLIALFMFSGVAEAKTYLYKYQFVLAATTDGQTPTTSWTWSYWKGDWEKRPIANSAMEMNGAIDVNLVMDTATNACDSTDWDLNFTHSLVENGVYSTTTHYYSIDNETKDTIESLPGGLTPPLGFIKPTIDEDSTLTCTIDIYFAVDKP